MVRCVKWLIELIDILYESKVEVVRGGDEMNLVELVMMMMLCLLFGDGGDGWVGL